jgi:hypothetical protein
VFIVPQEELELILGLGVFGAVEKKSNMFGGFILRFSSIVEIQEEFYLFMILGWNLF